MIPVLFNNPEDCCGCRVCANVCPKDAISFCGDKYGFLYPTVDEGKCIGCNLCVKSCDFTKVDEIGHFPLEGYAARHKESHVHSNSTSGGVFSALAEWIIQRQGIVYGCVFDDNYSPIHIGADSIEDVSPMRGSKYAQSDTGYIYRDVKTKLSEGRYVLFTGTPCQVAGLYSYLGKSENSKLLTADLICHGVPSAMALKKYLDYLEKKYHSKIESLKFRSKYYGWTRPSVEVCFKSGRVDRRFTGRSVYYANFHNNNLQRPSCFRCKYSCSSRFGDITIGDFWGFNKAHLKMSYKEGLSCCLINTQRAENVFGSLNLDVEKVDPSLIIQGNYHLRKSSTKGRYWDSVLSAIKRTGFESLTVRLLFYKDICKGHFEKTSLRIKKHLRKGFLKRVYRKIKKVCISNALFV